MDKQGLPSRNVTEGMHNAARRVFLHALGLDNDEIHRPLLGVVSAWDSASESSDAPLGLAEFVEEGVWSGGCVPRRFATVADGPAFDPGDGRVVRASLVTREIVADSIELLVRGHAYDGLVVAAASENALVGAMLAMCRLDIPGVLVPVVAPAVAADEYSAGIAMVAEVLGLAPAGACRVETLAQQQDVARRAGSAAADMVRRRASARDLVTAAKLEAAAIVLSGVGAAPDALIHLAAVASECGVPFTVEQAVTRTRHVPRLYESALSAARSFDELLSELAESGVLSEDGATGAPRSQGGSPGSAVHWVKGTLAPDGALVVQPVASPECVVAACRVFETEQDACAAIARGDCEAASALIVRGQGAAGAPGMRRLNDLADALAAWRGALVLTDGRLPRLASHWAITAVSPEGAFEGPLALVCDGDQIRVDVKAGVVDLLVDDATLAARSPVPFARAMTSSGRKYAALVGAPGSGAVTHPGARQEVFSYFRS